MFLQNVHCSAFFLTMQESYLLASKNTCMKKIKMPLLFIALLCLATIIALASSYRAVENAVEGHIYCDTDIIPYNKVGLLLGTNPIGPSGGPNYYFTYRIEAAVRLYEAGKISYILVSGDNHSKEYDEPMCMKMALMEKGVPESAIVLDYAGFRTLDSVVRAKEIFGQDSFTIISQRFHNERAICLAKHYGISAIGFNAKDVRMAATNLKIAIGRESMARVKMYIDILINKQPKFLGEKINIE